MLLDFSLDASLLDDPEYRGIGSEWSDVDANFLRNERKVELMCEQLNRCRWPLAINIRPKRRPFGNHNPVGKPDRITFNIMSNVNNGRYWMPLTAWMVLHRAAHAIQAGNSYLPDKWRDFVFSSFDRFFRQLTGDMFGPTYRREFYFPGIGNDHGASGFMTTGAARRDYLNNDLDIFAEAFTQFMVKGRFELLSFEESKFARLDTLISAREINDRLAEFGRQANEDLEDLCQDMIGMSFRF